MNKVGIWLRYGFSSNTSGGFSYYDALMTALSQYQFHNNIELVPVSPAAKNPVGVSNCVCLHLIPDNIPFLSKVFRNPIIVKLFLRLNARIKVKLWKSKLKKAGIPIIYYVNQNDYILTDYPFVATLWDMGYYKTYPFPELIQGRNFKGRMKLFSEVLPKALLIFAESEAGKRDLVKYANLTEDKIKVVPMFAGNVINMNVDDDNQVEILKHYELKESNFFFYPAQFWAHKNHYAIVKAFAEFKKAHPTYKIVFTGANKGTQDYIRQVCSDYGIKDDVLFLGFVEREELYTFYKKASALIMASFFGPTNMPPIEAMHLGCPVICSDIEGHREIMEDSALYFNPCNYKTLLHAMELLAKDVDAYKALVLKAKQTTKFNIHNALQELDNHLNTALEIRNTWSL